MCEPTDSQPTPDGGEGKQEPARSLEEQVDQLVVLYSHSLELLCRIFPYASVELRAAIERLAEECNEAPIPVEVDLESGTVVIDPFYQP